jgi:hypothetical protein
VNNNWHDIGPHLGFAYRALEGRKSFVVRGGYATTYFPVLLHSAQDIMRGNAPLQATYVNNGLTAAAQSPDGLANYGLVNTPNLIAGKNSERHHADEPDRDHDRHIRLRRDVLQPEPAFGKGV